MPQLVWGRGFGNGDIPPFFPSVWGILSRATSTQSRNRPDNSDSASEILAALEDEPPYDGTMNDGRTRQPLTADPDDDSENDPQYSGRSHSPPPRSRRRLAQQFDVVTYWEMFPNTLPPLGPALLPRVGALAGELVAETRGVDRFESASERDMWQEDETFARNRIASLAVIRQADHDARRMFLSELREHGRMSFPEMQLLMQTLSHFSPQLAKPRNNAKVPAFEEVGAHTPLPPKR